MDVRSANLVRKRLPCLRCARLFWTDRCHRVCARCQRLRRLHGVWDLIADLYRVDMSEEEKAKRNAAARQEGIPSPLKPPMPRKMG